MYPVLAVALSDMLSAVPAPVQLKIEYVENMLWS